MTETITNPTLVTVWVTEHIQNTALAYGHWDTVIFKYEPPRVFWNRDEALSVLRWCGRKFTSIDDPEERAKAEMKDALKRYRLVHYQLSEPKEFDAAEHWGIE